jgi:hypothetical protein
VKKFKYEYYLLLVFVFVSLVLSFLYSFGKLLALLCAESITVVGCITSFFHGRHCNTETEAHFETKYSTKFCERKSHIQKAKSMCTSGLGRGELYIQ